MSEERSQRKRPDTLELKSLGGTAVKRPIVQQQEQPPADQCDDHSSIALELAEGDEIIPEPPKRWFHFGHKPRHRRRLYEKGIEDAAAPQPSRPPLAHCDSLYSLATPMPPPKQFTDHHPVDDPLDPLGQEQYKEQRNRINSKSSSSSPSMLRRFAFWRRSSLSDNGGGGDDGGAGGAGGDHGGIGSAEPTSLLPRKARRYASSELDQISAATSMRNIRRISQMRRRRSSYYFSDNERRIRANDKDFNAQFKYHNNYIKTSKYSLLTFLPFNLLEQFQRLANFYFLCLLVLQLIPAISSLTPVTTAIPLIGVLTLTAVKDAYDDIQRHLSDSQVNNRKSKALRNGKLIDAKWSEVQVGDVIRLDNNQFVAADILLLTTSEPNGLCFIETAELDGETNLKAKQCLPETIQMGEQDDLLWSFNGEILCERPNNLLNKFEGTLMWNNQRFALDNDKILLRGCVLRNTQWCYGVVIFAGVDTKLMQNSGKTQFKSTGVDRLLNFIIIGIVLFLVSICAFFAIACSVWEGLIGQYFQLYLPWENIIPKELVSSGATVIGLLVFFSYAIVLNTVVPISLYVSVEVIRFVQSFLINWDEEMYYARTNTYAKARTTTLNEELGQIQYIFSDKTGTLTQNIMAFNKCSINGRSYGDIIDLHASEFVEVAQQQAIFQTSITNKGNKPKETSSSSPLPPPPPPQQQQQQSTLLKPPPSSTTTAAAITTTTTRKSPPPTTILIHQAEVHPKRSALVVSASGNTELATVDRLKGTCVARKHVSYDSQLSSTGGDGDATTNTTDATDTDTDISPTLNSSVSGGGGGSIGGNGKSPLGAYFTRTGARVRRQLSQLSTPTSDDKAISPVDFSANPHHEPDFRWYDQILLDAVRADEPHAHNFFRLLALCHTVMAETAANGQLEYQAQSPDEAALVSAARNFGFIFRTRSPNSITIEVMGIMEEYELLHILDFNNVRKRMSVILKRNDSVILYCKGADNVIYDLLHGGQDELKARTQDHLNKFASEGLRTLALAERRLTQLEYNDWRHRYKEASLAMEQREEKLNAIYEEIESNLSLVGVTAIEDKLQDGVPKSIANLQNAGIKIWVLTGDKQETAINIGYSCQLLTDELIDVFIVDATSYDEVEKQLRQFKESIKIFNRFRPGGPVTAAANTSAINMSGMKNGNSNGFMSGGGDSASLSINDPVVTIRQSDSLSSAPTQLPQPPAVSVVTFRWDDNIMDNKGGPDSAECRDTLFDAEKAEQDGDDSSDRNESLVLDENTGFAMVVNGHSLVHCLTPDLENKFLEIASQCKSVICCRVTPLQKALVVELIKRAKNAVTLAIGDGANDVSMIKAAHIGVGISGQEGLQAVLSSDYAIAQFRYLERLLLVHGRWSYYRMCKFLRYFFYKNFAFTLCHCWYSLFCGFSAQTVFDPMFISVYNLFYTSLPVLALGVFEQDVSDKNSLEFPRLYTPGLKSQLFNIREFIYSVLHGAFTSLILFLIPYGTYKDGIASNGLIVSDHMTLGAVVATILIVDNTAQIALYTSYWTIVNHITIWGSLVWYFVLDYFYNYVIGGPYVGSLTQAIKDMTFWVTMLITVVVLMAPVLAYKFYLLDIHPSLSDKIRHKSLKLKTQSRASSDVRRTPSARRGRRSVRSGYAFAHQEGFGRLITSGKIMHKLPQDFAFPLGLGTKRTQALHNNAANSAMQPIENGKPFTNNYSNNNNNNNIANTTTNQNHSSMADITSNGFAAVTGEGVGGNRGGDGSGGGGTYEDLSPRAPCQDLDTINL